MLRRFTRAAVLIGVVQLVVAACGSTAPSQPPGQTPTAVPAAPSPTLTPPPARPAAATATPFANTTTASPPASALPSRQPGSTPAPTFRPVPSWQPRARLITHGSRDRRWLALTFDADMDPLMVSWLRSGRVTSWYDARIVAELRRTHTPATVFLAGLWAQTYPGVVRSLAANPLFELDSITFDHAAWQVPCYGLATVTGVSAKRQEVLSAARVISGLAGHPPRYLRFPGGCHDQADLAIVGALGEQPLGWDVVSGDPFQPRASVIIDNVLRRVRPGSIVVLHLVGTPNAPATFDALRQLIPRLRAAGYEFVTVQRLLADGT